MRPKFPAFDYTNPQIVRERLRSSLPANHRAALEIVTAGAGETVWLVGGIVRDFLLERPNFDLDFVCLRPAAEIAQELLPAFQAQYGGQNLHLLEHSQFGTARLDLPPDLHIDFATARREVYAHPAALPTVIFPATLEEDMERRDFTFNALALSGSGRFYDPFNGLDDLRDGLLRVLHPSSFIDDPTRMVRGVRFAARLGYHFEPTTETLLRESLAGGYFALLSAERRRNELRLILKEKLPERALALLADYGLLAAIQPDLEWDNTLEEAFRRLNQRRQEQPGWLEYMGVLVHRLGVLKANRVAAELRFDKNESQFLVEVAQLWESTRSQLLPDVPNSRLYDLLSPYKPAALALFADLLPDEEVRAQVYHYLHALAGCNLFLNGDDLQRLGLPRGPQIKTVLNQLRTAVLDGQITSQAEAEAFVQRIIGASG